MSNQEDSKLEYYWLQKLQGKIHEDILNYTSSSDWKLVHKETIDYFERNCIGYEWTNHLALIMLARTAYARNSFQTVQKTIRTLNNRFQILFKELNIQSINDWNPDVHLYEYLNQKVIIDHSENQRFELLKIYNSSISTVRNWLTSKFDFSFQERFKPFLLTRCNISHSISNQKKVLQLSQGHRKNETDAIIPHYPVIRGEAHFRWNKLHRLYTKFNELIAKINPTTSLPLEFNYDEEKTREKLFFRIWDRPSFTLAHKDRYSRHSIESAKYRRRTYSNENNEYFLELVKVETLDGKQGIEGFWFEDLIKESVLNQLPATGSDEQKKRKKDFLVAWGYGDSNTDSTPMPFNTSQKGLLAQGDFICHAQNRANGVLMNIETFFAAATFGLAIVDLITTTGMRMNEVLQISYTKECIVVLEQPTVDRKLEKRYVLRLIPKGKDKPEDYFIGKETLNNLFKVFELLKVHYKDNRIPKVKYREKRHHLFPDERPYFFQYNYKHFTDDAVTACMRFLLHGMVFKTQEGNNVVLKAHLLRHAFATHAVQVEKIPLDIVGSWLHQKNIEVTDYYSAPTPSQVAQMADTWLKYTATHINIAEAVKRSPKELQLMYEEAKNKVGTLNKVIGGVCTSHSFCPSKFQCVGCAAKVPEPDKKEELLKMKDWAQKSGQEWRAMGLLPEANRMNQVLRDCDKELFEIELMEAYRKDEHYKPQVRVQPIK